MIMRNYSLSLLSECNDGVGGGALKTIPHILRRVDVDPFSVHWDLGQLSFRPCKKSSHAPVSGVSIAVSHRIFNVENVRA